MTLRLTNRGGALLATALLLAAGGVLLRPHEQMVEELGMTRTTTSDDGTTIAYTKLGAGPPLILVDGAFCYRENRPAFAARVAAR